ncbi:hypothetical protein GGS24DRAFT_484136 [Hypoxylon argillaceum]|nr:hypothetical protein GGS24DRAFT_484136 [Hypoxylon argillaceum]
MLFSSVLVAAPFVIAVTAQNFSAYVPDCAPPCVQQTLNSTKICASLEDNKCLCTNFSQIIFPSIQCFAQTCNATNMLELRSEITSGWQKFCNDSGSPTSFPTGWNPGGPESPVPSPSTSSSATSSISPTSSSPASNDTSSATTSGLSTGAKAGIGVGAGVGSLVLIGGLVFLGFRLGQQRKEASRSEAENAVLFNEGHPDDGQAYGRGGAGSAHLGNNVGGAAAKNGDAWAYKPDVEGAPLSELPSFPPRVEVPANEVKELPVTEAPAELWHGVLPTELSADSEISRDRITGTSRQ